MQICGVCITASLQVPVADIANQPSACSFSAQMWLQNNSSGSQSQPIGDAGELSFCAIPLIRINGKEGAYQRTAKLIPEDTQLQRAELPQCIGHSH